MLHGHAHLATVLLNLCLELQPESTLSVKVLAA